MQTVIAKYLANPSPANAVRVADYDRKHPMAACVATMLESAILADAIAMAKEHQPARQQRRTH